MGVLAFIVRKSGIGNVWSIDLNGSTQWGSVTTTGLGSTLSVFGWFNFDTVATDRNILVFNSPTGNPRLQFSDASGNMTFHQPGVVQTFTSGVSISTGVWVSIGLSYTSGALSSTNPKYFVNGSQATYSSTSGSGSASPSSTAFTLGGPASNITSMDGRCASIAFWNAALGATEFSSLHSQGATADLRRNFGNYTNSANLKLFFPLEEGTGTTATDLVSSASMSLVASPTWSSSHP